MSMLWFISDTHFGHENIIKYENRPFKNAREMDKALVDNWNAVVKTDDVVWHLGDVSLHGGSEGANIVKRLNGHKYLIIGNHDRKHSNLTDWWSRHGFERVFEHPICIECGLWLSHEPMYMTRLTPYTNVHGHIHSNKLTCDGNDGSYVNVSADVTNFTPITLEEVRTRIANDTECDTREFEKTVSKVNTWLREKRKAQGERV